MATAIPIDQVLGKLSAVRPHGDQWMAQCPAHDDRTSSLSVGIGRDGKILLKCFAGCPFDAILEKLSIRQSACFATHATQTTLPALAATYDYRDLDGLLRYQVCRFQPKDFRQRRPDGTGAWIWNMQGVERLPYQLDKLKTHETVYVVEGEKDADALWARGLPATTNSGGAGAGKWKPSDSEWLKAAGVKRVVLLPDNDGPGRKHMDEVAKSVKAAGLAVMLLTFPELPPKGDISDWFSAGHTTAQLQELVTAKPWVLPRGANGNGNGNGHPPTIDDELKQLQSRTSAGQAELFAVPYGAEFRFNFFRKMWLHYESPCWRPDADKAVYRAALDFVRLQQRVAFELTDPAARRAAVAFTIKAESPSSLENLLECATWNPVFKDKGDGWDADPWALAVNNGVIDLRTGILRPGSPRDRISMKCNVPYDKTAPCERWWQFLGEIFGGDQELIEFVWRLSGYILTGQTTERIVPMFYGRGANGKSVFLNVLSSLLGDYAFALPFSSLQFQKQEGIPNDLAALVGRRFVTMIEANDGLRLNEAKLKTLSGNDRISARFLHGEFFTFQPVCKFVLAMNHKPIAKDDSPGFWDRIRLVPFLHTFPEGTRDETLQAKLIESEGPGILAWAVEGCLRWQASGLTKPPAVINATAEYQADSDQLAEFLATCCTLEDPNAVTSASAVQKSYTGWADHRGLGKFERLGSSGLSRLLSERFEKKRMNNGLFYIGLEVFSERLWN